MTKILKAFRSVVFLSWLSFAFASVAISATVWALQLGATVTALTAQAASAAISHRRELAQAVARAKARARVQRLVAAVPIAGVGAIAYFKEQDFQDWKEQNPEGTRQQYACEVSALTAEVIDEVLQDLPESIRPEPATVLRYMPECT